MSSRINKNKIVRDVKGVYCGRRVGVEGCVATVVLLLLLLCEA
jgi:hypothetical protein